MTAQEIRETLAGVSYADWQFRVGEDDGTPWMQVRFEAPCNVTGEASWQHGRKWRLSVHMTKSEVVHTALKAVLTALEHEARERFTYRGETIFGPHFDVDRLAEMCAAGDAEDRRSGEWVKAA